MAEPLGFQIYVLNGKSWIVLKNFPPDAEASARREYEQMQSSAGFDGKKLTEETLEDDDKSYSHTLSIQIFDPEPTDIPEKPAAAEKPADNAGTVDDLRNFIGEYGEKLLGLGHNFFRAQKTEPFAEYGVQKEVESQNRRANARSHAYETRYPDESEIAGSNMIQVESIEVLGTEFLKFIEGNLVSSELRDDDRFQIGICCFAVGALVKMDDSIRFKGTRGKALLNDALRIFLPGEDTISTFIENMPQILAQPASARFIKAGALCFKAFQAGKFRKLEQRFKEIFAQIVAEKHALPAASDVAIFFVHIADIDAFHDDYGNVGVQSVLDDVWAELEGQLAVHNGRPLKSLGNGIMCVAADAVAMVEICAAAIKRAENHGHSDRVPNHQLTAGGHFGRAVERQGDYFGRTVEIAAALANQAKPGEACYLDALEEKVGQLKLDITDRSTAPLENTTGDLNILHVR